MRNDNNMNDNGMNDTSMKLDRLIVSFVLIMTGSYEIKVNDTLVFSKLKLGGFPKDEHVSNTVSLFLFLSSAVSVSHCLFLLSL